MPVKYEHPLLCCCRDNPASGTTCGLPLMVRDATLTGGLPSTMLHTSYHHHGGVRAPFRPYPRVVYRHRFKSLGLRKHPKVGPLTYVQRRSLPSRYLGLVKLGCC